MELKKGETIMTDAALHLPASFLHEVFSDRSGVPLDFFGLYYRGKRLEGEARGARELGNREGLDHRGQDARPRGHEQPKR